MPVRSNLSAAIFWISVSILGVVFALYGFGVISFSDVDLSVQTFPHKLILTLKY